MNTSRGRNVGWWVGDERNPREKGGRTGEPGKSRSGEPPREEAEGNSGWRESPNADLVGVRGVSRTVFWTSG